MKNSNKNSKIQQEIRDYLKLDLDLLYETLGREFVDEGDLIAKGKNVLKEIDQMLYQKICNEMEFCKNKSQFNYLDTKKLAKLLVANLGEIHLNETKVPETLVSVILVKIGLSRFCKC